MVCAVEINANRKKIAVYRAFAKAELNKFIVNDKHLFKYEEWQVYRFKETVKSVK
jgi:hypothetical protein